MRSSLHEEILRFRAARDQRHREGAARHALQLTLGMDLEAVLTAEGERRRSLAGRLTRLLRRERRRGLAEPLDYDLDRHIALGRVLQHLRADGASQEMHAGPMPGRRPQAVGARQRDARRAKK